MKTHPFPRTLVGQKTNVFQTNLEVYGHPDLFNTIAATTLILQSDNVCLRSRTLIWNPGDLQGASRKHTWEIT
jgi:hypothetical protein